jgi:hypothetical protein
MRSWKKENFLSILPLPTFGRPTMATRIFMDKCIVMMMLMLTMICFGGGHDVE